MHRIAFPLIGLLASFAAIGATPQVAPTYAFVVTDLTAAPSIRRAVIVIDVRTDTVSGPPIDVIDYPTGYVAISPGGRFVYVAVGRYVLGTPGGNDDHRIAVVDTERRQLVNSFPVNGIPGAIALTPDGGTMFAYKGYDLEVGTHAFAVMSLPSGVIRARIPVPFTSGLIAVSPDGRTVVAQKQKGLVFIDRDTNTATGELYIDATAEAITFSPDSATMYVAASGVSGGSIVRVAVRDRVVTGSIPLDTFVGAIAIGPDGRRLYVTIGGPRGSIFVVNADLWQIVTRVDVGPYPGAVSVTPDGDKVYVALQSKGFAVVSTTTNTVTKMIDGLGWVTNRGTNFVGPGSAASSTSVEYIHHDFGHYFTTNNSFEIDKLDAGDFSGWSRTGERFNVYPQPSAETAAVCRFFTNAFGSKSSHFFAPRGMGCEAATTNSDWQYEGDVYYALLPDATGACPAGTVPVYRLYNNGQTGAPNHRFSTKLEVRAEMLSLGWIAEGAGIGVGMCVPAR